MILVQLRLLANRFDYYPTTSRGGIFCCRLPYYTRRSAAGRVVGSGLDRSAGRQKIASLPYCVCRGDHWSPAHLPPQRIFRDGFLARQTGTGEQCPAPTPLYALTPFTPISSLLTLFRCSPCPKLQSCLHNKRSPLWKNQSRRDQPSGRGAKRRRQQHHRAPMAAHL